MENLKIDLSEYPRPDFARQEWIDLNGTWEFGFDDKNQGLAGQWHREGSLERTIQVPFCYQSPLSGIGETEHHPVVWYKKSLELDADFISDTVLLHFGAVDFKTDLWVNGEHAGSHRGGNVAFSFEVSRFLTSGTNTITLRVEDFDDAAQPRGKQSWRKEPFGCWYTPTTGIWQSVWMEKTGGSYLGKAFITPDIDNKCASIEMELENYTEGLILDLTVSFEGQLYKAMSFAPLERYPVVTVNIDTQDELDSRFIWSPENPALFDLSLVLKKDGKILDRVESYFGMRKVSSKEGFFQLNNNPYFQKLILDQGYWEDGILTPPDSEALKTDILKAKEMGFNGARKHQKFEDPRFYYWADKLGFLVWGEMSSNYLFNRKGMEMCISEWTAFLKSSYNHPSIVTWVPVNESWGVWNVISSKQKQEFCNTLYSLTKSIDQTRLVSGNDGWEQARTDICAIHDYVAWGDDFTKRSAHKDRYLATISDHRFIYADGYGYKGEPVMLTEYGGIAFDNGEEGWGYQDKVGDEAAFLARFRSMAEAIQNSGYINGLCYTQLTDVFQEVNGLLKMDRSFKVSPEKIKEILDPIRWN
ncbi:MAG: glycoside hydrolase family 2 TIM barrel-domain containing protein [Spirochaetales bacterium]|nr:glycoside hydrolase family 2 TIM barrel-domain containing protein [Spirochaetales bacterium]